MNIPFEISPYWFNADSFKLLIVRLFIDLIFIGILIRGIYYPINRKKEYLFSLFIFNVLIFFVSSLLSKVPLETGFAFGLFGIFSIIRYRTKQIPIKEMTFLFISIIVATINSTVTENIGLIELLFVNVLILSLSFLMERSWKSTLNKSFSTSYSLDEVKNKANLISSISEETGLEVTDFEIESINPIKKTAKLKVFYRYFPKS